MRVWVIIALLMWACPLTSAQQSASYRVEEHVFNAGGHPDNGVNPESTALRVSLGSIGDGLRSTRIVGASFSVEGGFVSAYLPPSEVGTLLFADVQTLLWQPERSVGDYALYEGTIGVPFDPGFGNCLLPTTPLPTATVSTPIAPGQSLFYLVTARNRLGEESTKGAGRANPAPCP